MEQTLFTDSTGQDLANFKEIISRYSGEGARIVWNSNLDNPNHWLNRDYIGKNDFSFKLDDNTFLSKRYIDSIKAKGKFYDRCILGKWKVAEGANYDDLLTWRES